MLQSPTANCAPKVLGESILWVLKLGSGIAGVGGKASGCPLWHLPSPFQGPGHLSLSACPVPPDAAGAVGGTVATNDALATGAAEARDVVMVRGDRERAGGAPNAPLDRTPALDAFAATVTRASAFTFTWIGLEQCGHWPSKVCSIAALFGAEGGSAGARYN